MYIKKNTGAVPNLVLTISGGTWNAIYWNSDEVHV